MTWQHWWWSVKQGSQLMWQGYGVLTSHHSLPPHLQSWASHWSIVSSPLHIVIQPTIHPTSSCLQSWGQVASHGDVAALVVVCCCPPIFIVLSPPHLHPPLVLCISTCNPLCNQWLTGEGLVMLVLSWGWRHLDCRRLRECQ